MQPLNHRAKSSLRSKMVRTALVPMGLMVLWGAIVFFNMRVLVQDSYQVEQTYSSIAKATHIMAHVVSMEAGLRGYAVTGKEKFLEPYHKANQVLDGELNELKQLVLDNPVQIQRLGRITRQISTWKESWGDSVIGLRKEIKEGAGADEAMRGLIQKGVGKKMFDEIRKLIAEMENNLGQKENNESRLLLSVIGTDLLDMETGMRGYVITGRPDSLEPYDDGLARLTKHSEQFKEQIPASEPKLAMMMRELNSLIEKWKNEAAAPQIELRGKIKKTMVDMAELISTEGGKRYLDLVREGVDDFLAAEKSLLHTRQVQASSTRDLTMWSVVLGSILTLSLGAFLAFIVSGWVLSPVVSLSQWARQVASGELEQHHINTSDDELGELNASITDMTGLFADIVWMVDLMARGEIPDQVNLRSEKDEVGRAINGMVGSFSSIVDQANAIAKGDYSADLKPRSPKDILSISMANMTRQLREFKASSQEQSYIKTGQAEIAEILRGEQDLTKLAQSSIRYICKYMGASVGAFYIKDQDGALKLTGGYAFVKREGLPGQYRLGEGILGQAALEGRTIRVNNCPQDYVKIQSGLGEAAPMNLIASPLIYQGEVLGVVEIGAFKEFRDMEIIYLETCSTAVAAAVHTVRASSTMAELLEQTRQQAQEMQVQQEELRVTNEELEEQAKALKESESRLTAQQEELRVANEELEEQAKSLEIQQQNLIRRNGELSATQKKLRQKALELEQASQYKSEFLANMSHELRTPLNSMLLLSQLLAENKSKNLSDKQLEFTTAINSAGNDLLALINDVLDLSKVEAGQFEVNMEPINLAHLAEGVQRDFQQLSDEKNLFIKVSLAEGVPDKLASDSYRLKQILKNLLSNAFKFTEHGGVELIIHRPDPQADLHEFGLDPAQTVAFSVKDTGIGIPREKQQIIFEAFKQADGTTSRKYGGTGLGLSISRQLAKLLGGGLGMESESGKGSVFTLYLPAGGPPKQTGQTIQAPPEPVQKAESEPGGPEAEASPKAQTGFPGQVKDDRKNIKPADRSLLIVEDDPGFAEVLLDLARERGFKGMVAEDGKTALHFADYYNPSAVILDVGLPGMDGWTIMERLKDDPKTRHIPVHFVSGLDKDIEAMKMGAIGYQLKPVNLDGLSEIFGKIEQAISAPIRKLLLIAGDQRRKDKITGLIGKNGLEVVVSGDTSQAFETLSQQTFDCVILDMHLKGRGAFEFLGMVKGNTELSHTPIIVYSEKDLSWRDEAKLRKMSENVVIKSAHSQERLLSEVTLFLHSVESKLPAEQQRMLKMVHDKEAILKGRTVLLADDDMRNVFAISAALEERGVVMLAAKNGREALAKLEDHPEVELVIMDIMMPEMDGYETMMEIRKDKKHQSLPIIALTAKAMKGDRMKCIEAGASDYLAKPVDMEKMISLMRVWLYR